MTLTEKRFQFVFKSCYYQKMNLPHRCNFDQDVEKNEHCDFTIYFDQKKSELPESSHYMQGSTNAMQVVEGSAF